MNLNGIDVFVKVIQLGSFAAAAKHLRMPTTTVSNKVQILERELGVTLIQRTTRKLQLTEEGAAYFRRCVIAIEELEAGVNEINAGKSEPEGTIKISTVAELGQSIIAELVQGYLEKYPKMNVELILTPRVVDLIGEGVDLAIRYGQLKDSSLIAKKIADISFDLYASSGYIKKHGSPKTGRDLKNHSIIRFTAWSPTLKFSSNKETIEVATSPRLVVDDLASVRSFAMNGLGTGILPHYLADKLVRVAPHTTWGTVPLSFVYPPQRFVSPKVQSFIQYVSAHKDRFL